MHSSFPFTGSFTNPAPLAGFLTGALCSFPCLYFSAGRKRAVWIVGGILTLFCIAYSGSRASWVAVSAGVFVCFLPSVTGLLRKFNVVKRLACIGVFALLVLALCTGLYLLRSESVDGRVLIWKSSYSLFAQSPIYGNGPGSFTQEYMHHQATYLAERLLSGDSLLADNVAYAFSEPVRILCEYGVVGFILSIIFMASIVTGTLKNPSTPNARFILSGILALIVFGLFSYPAGVYPIRLLFVVLAALAVKESRWEWAWRITLKAKTMIPAALISLWVLIASSVHYAHARSIEKTIAGWFAGEHTAVPEEAYLRFKNYPEVVYTYGHILYQAKEYGKAIPVFEQAAGIAPTSPLFVDLGKCYYHTSHASMTELCLKTAVNMTPGYVSPAYELFNFYRKEHKEAEARYWAEYISKRKFKVMNSVVLFAKKEANAYISDRKKVN